MKITEKHYLFMKKKMAENKNKIPAMAIYEKNKLSEKRYRWDLVIKSGLLNFICDDLYKYLNDSHIDTALRKIVKEI